MKKNVKKLFLGTALTLFTLGIAFSSAEACGGALYACVSDAGQVIKENAEHCDNATHIIWLDCDE